MKIKKSPITNLLKRPMPFDPLDYTAEEVRQAVAALDFNPPYGEDLESAPETVESDLEAGAVLAVKLPLAVGIHMLIDLMASQYGELSTTYANGWLVIKKA